MPRRNPSPPASLLDFDPTQGMPYTEYGCKIKGWSRSTTKRRELFLPVYRIPGIGKMIIPNEAEDVLRGQPNRRRPILLRRPTR
jgi:hypothetical protein